MKVKDLLQALLKVKDMEQEVFIHVADINPYSGMHELKETGPALLAYEDYGGFFIEGEMAVPEGWENDGKTGNRNRDL